MAAAIGGMLARLEALAGPADRDVLAALADRLASSRLRVLVVGEAKRGKSTLINALLGRDILPAGVTPLTAVPTTVIEGSDEQIDVVFADGRGGTFPLAALADFGTERGNPGNKRQVASIKVRVESAVLARGVEIVDTPGTGSVHAHNSSAADAVLPSMDAAILVLTADPPVSAAERALLSRVADLSVRLFVVLNKSDYLDAAGLAEALAFTEQVVAEATGQSRLVYPLSARSALGPTEDGGFSSFAGDFAAYLETGRAGDLQASAARQAGRMARVMLDETMLAQHAARLPGDEAAQRMTAFAALLGSVTGRGAEAEDRVAAHSGRLLAALNEAASQIGPEVTATARKQLTEVLDGELAGASPAEIERTGRASLTALAVDGASRWRQTQAARLEAGLREVEGRLAAELEASLDGVRAAAADLLGLQLAVPGPGDRLGAGLSFFYVLGEHVDQAELLAGAVRRHLPGELGRRVARQHVIEQVPGMVDAQVGRARGDLQYRLMDAARRLQADVRRRYADSTARLAAALERAAAIRVAAAGQGTRELAELSARQHRLETILAELAADAGARAGSAGP